MTTAPSLLALTRALATDDETKAAYRDDPEGFLDAHGHGDLDPAQLTVALEHVADALPAPLAAALHTVGDAGVGLGDLLAGVAGIETVEAEARWAALTGADLDPVDELDDRADADPETGDLGADPGDLGEDPADLDDEPGGFDAATDPEDRHEGNDRPGGLDRVDHDDTTFGQGSIDEPERWADHDEPGGFDPVSESGAGLDVDPLIDPDAAWPQDLDPAGGLDPAAPADPGDSDDTPGGLDEAD